WSALVVNGRTKKTPARAASAAMSIQRRETRSIRRPAKKPMATIGRNSTIRRPLTQFASPVRSKTSTTSATNASQVPMLDARVAKKSSRKPGARRKSSTRAPSKPHFTDRTVPSLSCRDKPSKGGACAFEHVSERRGEELVLLPGAHRDPDRTRSAERAQRPHDHALAQESVENRASILAHFREDEIGDRWRSDPNPQARAGLRELRPPFPRRSPAEGDLFVVAETR